MTALLKFISPRDLKTRKTTRVVLPVEPVTTETVRAFMRECMVPILAKEFLRLRDTAPIDPTEVKGEERTFRPVGKEDGL